MSWTIEVKPNAIKQYKKLDKTLKTRIKNTLIELEKFENPLHHKKIKPLVAELKGDYRLRIGNWRIFFTPDVKNKILYAYAILPRGNAYKN